jgi:hypothetical protein
MREEQRRNIATMNAYNPAAAEDAEWAEGGNWNKLHRMNYGDAVKGMDAAQLRQYVQSGEADRVVAAYNQRRGPGAGAFTITGPAGTPPVPAQPQPGATATPSAPPITTPQGGLLASTVGTPQNPQPPMNPATMAAPPLPAPAPSAPTPAPADVRGYEDDSVAGRMNDLTRSGSEFMQLAEYAGRREAGRRGLLSSSIAAGAARGAAIERAAPLAMQEAQQRAQRNALRLDAGFQRERQTAGFAHEVGMQGRELDARERLTRLELDNRTTLSREEMSSRERIANAQISSQESMLGRQLTAQETAQVRELAHRDILQQRDIASQQTMQERQLGTQRELTMAELTSRERVVAQQIASEEARLGRQLTAQEEAQTRDLASRASLLGTELASREGLAREEMTSRASLLGTELASRERLTREEIASREAQLGRQLTAEETRQATEIAARQSMLSTEIASREALTREELGSRERTAAAGEAGANLRANLDAATRVQLQAQENLNDQQKSYLSYYMNINNQYQNSIDALWANKDMPAPARDAAIKQFTALRDANLNVAQAVYGARQDWGTAPAPAPTPAYGGQGPTMPAGLTREEQAQWQLQNQQYAKEVAAAYGTPTQGGSLLPNLPPIYGGSYGTGAPAPAPTQPVSPEMIAPSDLGLLPEELEYLRPDRGYDGLLRAY